jgi:hypothetical protein
MTFNKLSMKTLLKTPEEEDNQNLINAQNGMVNPSCGITLTGDVCSYIKCRLNFR